MDLASKETEISSGFERKYPDKNVLSANHTGNEGYCISLDLIANGNHSGKGSSDLVVGRTMMYFGRLLLIGDGRNVSKAKRSHSIETEFWMTSDKAGVTNCALKTCHMDECFVAQWVCHGASLDSVLTNVTISFIKQIIIILVAVQSIVSTHKTLQFILLFATYWTFQTILKL